MATFARGFLSDDAATGHTSGRQRKRDGKRPKPTRLGVESLESRTVLSASASPLAAYMVSRDIRDCVVVPRNCNDVQTPAVSAANEVRSANYGNQCDTAPVCETKPTIDSKQRCDVQPASNTWQQRCETTPSYDKQRCETKSTVNVKQQQCEVKSCEVKQRCETLTPEVRQQRCDSTPKSVTQNCETKSTCTKPTVEAKSSSDSKQRCETKSTTDTKQQRCEVKPVCEVKRCSDAEPVRATGAKTATRNCEPEVKQPRSCADSVRQVAAKATDGCFGDMKFMNDLARKR